MEKFPPHPPPKKKISFTFPPFLFLPAGTYIGFPYCKVQEVVSPYFLKASSLLRAGGTWFASTVGLRCAFDPTFFTREKAVLVRALSRLPFSAWRKASSRLRVGGVWAALAAGRRCAFDDPAIILERLLIIKGLSKLPFLSSWNECSRLTVGGGLSTLGAVCRLLVEAFERSSAVLGDFSSLRFSAIPMLCLRFIREWFLTIFWGCLCCCFLDLNTLVTKKIRITIKNKAKLVLCAKVAKKKDTVAIGFKCVNGRVM